MNRQHRQMYEKAVNTIYREFEGKVDKGGQPYTEHLFNVASGIMVPHTPDVRIAALLHDIIEDCGWTEEQLRFEFNDEVARLVSILTHKKGESYENYITRILQDHDACLIKESDLEHNMDLTRLKHIFNEDMGRIMKYHRAYRRIREELYGS